MKFENVNELNAYINANYKKINITGVDTENSEIFIDGELTKNKQYVFIKFSDEKAYMQYKNQHDIAGIDALKVVSHQINVEEFYTLMDSKKVAYIEFIKIEEVIETGELTYTDTTVGWAFDRANIGYAWERGYTGAGIKALIVDNGFHEIPGELEFVDVYAPIWEDDLTKVHGTNVASCLGAKKNDTGLVGVAPDIELYGVVTGNSGIGPFLTELVNYIVDNGIRIVNFSIVVPASTPNQTMIDAFEYLDSLGVLVFAAQGNFGQHYGRTVFSRIPTVIGVGGINLDSNNNLEISTGEFGATNNIDCDYLFSYHTNILTKAGTVVESMGTSFGTPSIAGMFALLMQEFPNATKKELMDIMNYGGEKVDNYYGIFPKYGGHLEQLVEIYPPDFDSKLKVYPVTLSTGVIERGNKLFVNQEEREYLERVTREDFGLLVNYREKLVTVSAENGSIDLDLGNVFQHTPSGNVTYSITNAVDGQAHSFTLIINMGSTARTLTFPTSVKWQVGGRPDMTIPSTTYVLRFMTVDGGATWLGMTLLDAGAKPEDIADANCKVATDADFSGDTNGNFRYIGTATSLVIPHVIKGVLVTSYASMFEGSNVVEVRSNNSRVTSMYDMFRNCTSLTSLDLSNFDTSNVTSMDSMFRDCTSLTSLDLSGFDTSNVTSMDYMFYDCTSLTSLDLSGFDTSNVTNMNSMFRNCTSLTPLDVSGFDTSNVTGMADMFNGCNLLTSLDLNNFDTSNVASMMYMFNGCNSLASLDVSGFDTSNVASMMYMFNGCNSLASLDVSGFDTSKVTSMIHVFNGCKLLTSLDLNNFDTSNVTRMDSMFRDCTSITSLDLSNFDTSKVTGVNRMFQNCTSITTAYARTQEDADKFNTSGNKASNVNFVVK